MTGTQGVHALPQPLAECSKRRSNLLREDLGLFPRREVAALVDRVEVDEVRIRLLRPASRRLVLLAGKDGYGDRHGDALDVEEAALVFPVETRRRDPGVR